MFSTYFAQILLCKSEKIIYIGVYLGESFDW